MSPYDIDMDELCDRLHGPEIKNVFFSDKDFTIDGLEVLEYGKQRIAAYHLGFSCNRITGVS